jgi:hypothetical protein
MIANVIASILLSRIELPLCRSDAFSCGKLLDPTFDIGLLTIFELEEKMYCPVPSMPTQDIPLQAFQWLLRVRLQMLESTMINWLCEFMEIYHML